MTETNSEQKIANLEKQVSELRNGFAELKNDGSAAAAAEVDAMIELGNETASPLETVGDVWDQSMWKKEEDEAVQAIRAFGGSPEKYNIGQFQEAARALDWPTPHFQARLEGFVKQHQED